MTKRPRLPIRSLKFRFIVLFAVFIIVLCGVITFVSFRQIVSTARIIFSAQGLPLIRRTMELIDGDKFETLAASRDTDDPYYEEIRLKMLAMKENSDCLYLYTMSPLGGTVYQYVIDGSVPPGEEGFSAMGNEEDMGGVEPTFFWTMERGTVEVSSLYEQEGWGWMISMYGPIKNSQGRIVGIIGCDFDGALLRDIVISQIRRLILLSLGFLLAGLLLLVFFLYMIFNPIKIIGKPMEEIASGEGDLTVAIPVIRTNEMGNLARDFNRFLEKLREIVKTIKTSAADLTVNTEQVRQQSLATIDSLEEVFFDLNGIRNQADVQDNQAKNTYDNVKRIEEKIDSLETMISRQHSAVRQASASISQMSAGIQAVSENMDQISRRYVQLVNNARLGKENQEETGNCVTRIVKETENLMAANTAINKIAAQTNLLSMNAAIEAAHAGDAGRGFAVVAEEIRKLSETSSEQSKTIKQYINEIQETSKLIVSASDKSMASFDSINQDINELSGMISQVNTAVAEQNRGIQDILEATNAVKHSTQSINIAAKEMKDTAIPVFEEINASVKNTASILEHSRQSLKKTEDLQKRANLTLETAARNGNLVAVMIETVNKFKI